MRHGGAGRGGTGLWGVAEETVGGAKWGEGVTRKGKLRYCVGEGTGVRGTGHGGVGRCGARRRGVEEETTWELKGRVRDGREV